MVINMDTELQRLICVSVEKMTREPVPSRKGKGLDLRKALLVAHVLQDMRTAYIADDYRILVNTVCPETKDESLEKALLRKEYDECLKEDVLHHKRTKFLSDDWATGSIERPPRSESGDNSFMTSPYRCPSGSQPCLPTCSDATMSKISQKTHPIPVSINTSYILSHQMENRDDDIDMDDVTPSVSEQVEITMDSETDDEPVESEVIQCEDMLNDGPGSPEIILDTSTVTTYRDLSGSDSVGRIQTITCPLPRKKRPLPKEYLEPNESTELDCKKSKLNTHTATSLCGVTVTSSPCRLLNTTTATTLTHSTALSCTRAPSPGGNTQSTQLCSTVTSSVSSMTVVSSSTTTGISTDSKAKVVVELMHKSAWSWSLPATCTQPRLSRRLTDGVFCSQLVDVTNLRDSSVHTLGLKNLVTV